MQPQGHYIMPDTMLCEFINFFTFCSLINIDFIAFQPLFNYLHVNQEPIFSGRKKIGGPEGDQKGDQQGGPE